MTIDRENKDQPGKLRIFADFFGLRRSIVGVLAMCILIGMGEKMAERFLPIYLVALGGGSYVVGFLNAMDNLLSALYSYPGGWLADRFGIKRSLSIFNLVAMLGYIIVLVFPSYQAVLLGSIFFISWTALSLPATMGLIAEVLPKKKRTMGVTVHSLIRRIPMALGPVVGGIFVTYYGPVRGVQYAFVGALVMAIIAMIFQEIMIVERPKKYDNKDDYDKEKSDLQLIGPELKKLLIADILVRFCEQIPYPFVVIWCMNMHGATGIDFGVFSTIEMITAMLIYIPVAWLADRSNKKPFVVATFIFFTLFPLTLLFCRSFWPLVGAFIIRGFKEFGEPTRKALIMDLAPEGKKAAAFGTYYLIRDTIVSIGAFSGAFLWELGPRTNLLAAVFFGLCGTIWFAFWGTDLTSTAAKT